MDEKAILELCDKVRQTAYNLHTFFDPGTWRKFTKMG
jgi:hypothetical protein